MKIARLLALLPLVAVTACAAPLEDASSEGGDDGAAGTTDENVATTSQALVGPEYESTDDAVRLWRADLAFCFLTGISGDLLPRTGSFEIGRGAALRVRDGYWWLDTHGATARARCVPFADFRYAGSGKLYSAPEGWWANRLGQRVSLWGPSTLCFMGGAGNGYDGGAQRLTVTRETAGWVLATAGAMVDTGNIFFASRTPVSASGSAMCIDTGRTSSWRKTDHAWTQSEPQRWMMPTSEGVCMLTGIGGKFAGGGEGVEIAEESGHWVLRGHSMQHGVGATAQCVPYGQLVLTKPLLISPF